MPIKSTKPSRRGPYKGTPPKPPMSSYASEAQITSTASARRQITRINQQLLSMTQPYARAAELRGGQVFPRQQRLAMGMERAGVPVRRAGRRMFSEFL